MAHSSGLVPKPYRLMNLYRVFCCKQYLYYGRQSSAFLKLLNNHKLKRLIRIINLNKLNTGINSLSGFNITSECKTLLNQINLYIESVLKIPCLI